MSKPLNIFSVGLVVAALSVPVSSAAEEASVVLVHGAFSDGSAWHKVIPILQDAGIAVSAAQLPMSSLQEDAAVVTRLLEMHEGPVVLVGHSYGGSVITEAGAHDDVSALVYVAGFALEAGQALGDLLEGQPPAPWRAEVTPDSGGFLHLSAAGMGTFFAPDLPPDEVAVMAATQSPIQYKINAEPLTVAAWSVRPTYYVIAENDQIISPKFQTGFAKRMGAQMTQVASGHAAMLSQPEAVAEVILQAAQVASDK